MKNFLKKTDLPKRLIAIILALLLWGVVMMRTDPMRSHIIKTVPGSIELEGVDVLLEQHNLSVIEGQDAVVSFSVEGTSSAITALMNTAAQVRIVVDVSGVDSAGEHELPYTIQLPNASGVTINDSYRSRTVNLVIDEMTSKEVPVVLPEDVGTPANGYIYDTSKISTDTVTVDGPNAVLQTIATAQLSLKADGLNKTQSMSCEYTLLDSDGQAVDSPHLTRETEKVNVTIPVYKYETVPLEVEFHPTPEITEDMVKVKIDPETVQIYGTDAAVDKISSISLGEIDLSRVQNGARITMGIRLPAGIKLMDGQPGTAAVTLQIDGVSSKTVKISDVQLVDNSGTEPKLAAKLGEEAIELTLSGKNSALTSLDPADIKVTATFDSSVYGVGTHMIPVQVALPPDSGITVIGEETLQVPVILSEPGTDASDGGSETGGSEATAGESAQ